MTNLSLSEMERDILQILWQEGRALSRPEILAHATDKSWSPNSIHQALNSMMKKEVLGIEGIIRCGRVYGRTYIPRITKEDLISSDVERLMPNETAGKRLLGVFAALTGKGGGIDAETIDQLQQILDKERQELKHDDGDSASDTL